MTSLYIIYKKHGKYFFLYISESELVRTYLLAAIYFYNVLSTTSLSLGGHSSTESSGWSIFIYNILVELT